MDYLKDFGLDGEFNTTIIKTQKKATRVLAISKSVAALLDISYSSFVEAMVIAPKKTKMESNFANDPHIGFSQPGTWYEAHIVTPELNYMVVIWQEHLSPVRTTIAMV
jgi:penicillin amidase